MSSINDITTKRKQKTRSFFNLSNEINTNQESFREEQIEESRAAKDQNQSIGFGCFANFDSTVDVNESFGFQTGTFKQISLDEECLKKARLLFQSQQEDNSSQFKSKFQKNQACDRHQKNEQKEQNIDFSAGFSFANGNGQMITISPSKMRAAQQLLDSQSQNNDQQQQNIVSSPTRFDKKSKILSKCSSKKIQIMEQKTIPSLHKSYNKLLIIQNSTRKSKKRQLQSNLIEYPLIFQNVRRQDIFQQSQIIDINLSQYQKPIYLQHKRKECLLPKCIFCQQHLEQVHSQIIISILCKKYGMQYEQKFIQWYHHVVFKLFKYNKYFPQLFNKRLNAPNVISQLQHKYLKQLKSFRQPFGLSLRSGKVQEGIAVNLAVLAVHQIPDKQYYLLQLSDGWYSLYVPIKQQNNIKNNSYYLNKLIKNNRIYPGIKIQIYGWYDYPVKGILNYLDCPNMFSVIQIKYNSLIKLPQSSKLGIATQLYYKQVSKCHPECGLVSIYSLYLVRIIVDYKQQKVWFRLANTKQSYLLFVAGGLSLIDQYKQKQWFDCTNLKMVSRFDFENTRISKMLMIENKKGFNYVLKQLLWNSCSTKHPYKPCDLIIKIEQIDEDEIRGFYQNNQIIVSIKNTKINITDMDISQHKLITEVVYLTKGKSFQMFQATSLSRVVASSSHALYQTLLNKRNQQLIQSKCKRK